MFRCALYAHFRIMKQGCFAVQNNFTYKGKIFLTSLVVCRFVKSQNTSGHNL